MGLSRILVNYTIKGLTLMLLRIDASQVQQVPLKGPLILVTNHINFLDVPVLFTQLIPRPVTGFAKKETWDSPILGRLFTFWGGIPLQRGEADVRALRRGLEAVQAGHIIGIAPEGTRSNHGRLQCGHPGVVTLALHSGAPLLPVAAYGQEKFRSKISHLQRCDCHIAVGRLFRIEVGNQRVTHMVRQEITDQIMYQIACLLPPDNRGVYADLSRARQDYLRFVELNNKRTL